MSASPAPLPSWAEGHIQAGERVLWWARPSLWALLSAALPLGALGLSLVAFAGFVGGLPALLGTAGLGAVVLVFLAVPIVASRLVQVLFSVYVVTDERFYQISSLLAVRVRSVPLSRVSKVEISQGLLLRALGLWSASVSTYKHGTGRGASSRAEGESSPEDHTLRIPAVADGEGLRGNLSEGLLRGSNVAWLVRGD